MKRENKTQEYVTYDERRESVRIYIGGCIVSTSCASMSALERVNR